MRTPYTVRAMPDWMPEFVTPQLVASLVVILIIIHLLLGAAAYLILLERKVCAWVQDRIGPNRVGPMGLLQPIADSIKLLVKEDYVPRGAPPVSVRIRSRVSTVIATRYRSAGDAAAPLIKFLSSIPSAANQSASL